MRVALTLLTWTLLADSRLLQQDGHDRYQTLVAVIGHHGTCQPSCSEQRILSVQPNVFYKVKIEVAQVDMHSNDEQVKVKVGSQEVTCSPRVASDYNCSLIECSQLNFGRVINSQLRIQVEATKTRDTCKCTVLNGDVDCYSELLSGLDPTYGALVRLSFEPQVRAEWVLGDWSTCSDFACITPGRQAERSVQCRIFDPDDVGDGASRCSKPKPAAFRPCAEAPECQPPPPCDNCFYIAHLSDLGVNWSAIVMRPSGANHVQVGETGQPMRLQLLLGLAHVSCDATLLKLEKAVAATTVCVSLAKCDDRGRLLTWTGASDTELGGFKDLVLAEDDGSAKFRMSATFHLRQVGTAGYILANPYSRVDLGTPSFSLVRDLPSYISSSQMQQISELYNETCAVDDWSLVPPKLVCQEVDGSFTCPDEEGAFGHCCLPGECPSGASPADCERPTGRNSVAYVTSGRCEDIIRCSAIEDGNECQRAAAALGFARKAKVNLRLSDLVTRFCSWEYGTPDNGSPILWLNRKATSTMASVQNPQLCRCGEARPLRRYQWRVAGWSLCSRSCGKQRRYRKVNCHELIGFASTDSDYSGEGSVVVPSLRCREAGLEEPPSSEPCSTPECWKAEEHTRCAGSNRILDPEELGETSGAWLVMNRNDTGPTYCVAMNASSVAAVATSVVPELMVTTATAPSFEHLDLGAATELCRKICSQLGSCVGFTLYDHVFGDPNVAQCCFLRRATRWQPNFRRATCHLARGAQTRSGCFCQVGWEIDGGRPSVCGPQRGGCCTTPDNGAVSWCPTTSPSCGTQLQNQKHTDICDLRRVAAVSEHTCRTHPGIRGRQCASARGISECNQIATVLGLPDTIPEVELAMNMPSGCVWQKATSELWLNQLVDAVNASDPSQKVTMSASEEMSELCLCMPTEEYYWEVGEWRPCFRSKDANCHGARERTRSVHCVRADTLETWRYEVVPDAKCSAPRPETVSACTECDRQVIAAVGEFNMPEPVAGLQASDLAAMCSRNLAAAVGIDDSDRVSVGQVDCCASSVVPVEILITDGKPGSQSAAAVIDDVMRISRSRLAWSQVSWIDELFGSMMQHFSLSIRGTYSWEVSDSWGPCSEACGGGVQTREVWCSWTNHEDEAMVAENQNCHAPSQPQHQRSCSSRPCRSCPSFKIGPQYVVSGGDNKVYVTCAAGYESVDDIRLVESECKDGEWTPLAVSCGRNCPNFAAASWKYNVTGSGNLHGSTRQITCKRSETSENSVEDAVSASVICQDGSWTTPSLVCTGDCLTPELTSAYAVSQINGTSADNVAQPGTVWQISCAPGFSARADQTFVKLECERGSWSGLKDIPDCKADCPRYKLFEGYEIVGDEDAQRVVAWDQRQWQEEEGSQDQLPRPNITGVNHGTRIGIRCVEGYGRVPGAVERVECNDGQWSPLSLSCSKDCRPFNTSILEYSRFRVITDPIMDDSSQADAPHGSKIVIGCKIDEEKNTESMKRGEVTCDNGWWIPSDFRCFHDCRPFVPGKAYSALIPGALASQRNRSVPHGTQLLATCAQGFSTLPSVAPNSSSGGGKSAERRITPTPNELIAESECVDGHWTDITLQCFPDCPSWPMKQRMVMDSGGGLRVGSLLRLACASKPDVAVRCGMHGTWELLTEDGDSVGRNLKFLVGKEVTAEEFVKMCPSFVHTDARDVLKKMTFWAKLSDDERAMFMILTLGCIGSLCGLACTYFLSPYVVEEPPEDEALGDSEATHQSEDTADPPGLRRFNLLTGEVERHRTGRRKHSAAHRLSKFAQRSAGRLTRYLQDASARVTSCANCDRAATHVCFPCSHLCLCLSCAEDFLQSFHGPGFQELANHHMAPREDGMDIIEGQPSCPLCGQFVFCVIDAKPAKVFELPGPLDLALTAASATATSLRRTAAFAAQGARDVANRSGISPTMVGPTTVGRSRDATGAVASHPL